MRSYMSACAVLVLADMLADLFENSPQHGSGFDIDHWKRPPKNQDGDLRKSFFMFVGTPPCNYGALSFHGRSSQLKAGRTVCDDQDYDPDAGPRQQESYNCYQGLHDPLPRSHALTAQEPRQGSTGQPGTVNGVPRSGIAAADLPSTP